MTSWGWTKWDDLTGGLVGNVLEDLRNTVKDEADKRPAVTDAKPNQGAAGESRVLARDELRVEQLMWELQRARSDIKNKEESLLAVQHENDTLREKLSNADARSSPATAEERAPTSVSKLTNDSSTGPETTNNEPESISELTSPANIESASLNAPAQSDHLDDGVKSLLEHAEEVGFEADASANVEVWPWFDAKVSKEPDNAPFISTTKQDEASLRQRLVEAREEAEARVTRIHDLLALTNSLKSERDAAQRQLVEHTAGKESSTEALISAREAAALATASAAEAPAAAASEKDVAAVSEKQLRERSSGLEKQLEESQARERAAQLEVDGRKEELRAAHEELVTLKARVGGLGEELDVSLELVRSSGSALDGREVELRKERQQCDELRRDLAQRDGQREKLRLRAEKAIAQRDDALVEIQREVLGLQAELLQAQTKRIEGMAITQTRGGGALDVAAFVDHAGADTELGDLLKKLRDAEERCQLLQTQYDQVSTRCVALERDIAQLRTTASESASAPTVATPQSAADGPDGEREETDEVDRSGGPELARLRSKVESLQRELRRAKQTTAGDGTSAQLEQLRSKVGALRNDNLKLRTDLMDTKRRLKDAEAERGLYILNY